MRGRGRWAARNGLRLDDQRCLFGVLSRESVIRFQSRTPLGEMKGDIVDSDLVKLGRQLLFDGFDKVVDIVAVLGGYLGRMVDNSSSSRIVGLEQNP